MPVSPDSGDTAWLLVSAALVLLMIPGLALFYGGMVRIKSTLNMLMMTFAALAVVSAIWVTYGYSLAFGPDAGAGLIGDLSLAGMAGIGPDAVTGSVPTLVFAAFQMMFAIITAALLSGAIADRAKFGTWVLFVAIWVTLVYAPIAHWVFTPDGWIAHHLRILDLAGGTVVEINSGASGLALAIVLGPRLGFRSDPMRPHSLPLVVLGAGLLWFGWFGFNAGSALAADGSAALAFFNTQVSGAAGIAGWLLVERLRDGHATTLGAASGAVAGLVAITPACGSVNPVCALLIGLAAGALCGYAVGLKHRLGLDDSLDVAGVHGVGGFLGTVLIGLLATATATGGPRGLLFGGGFSLLGRQALAAVTVALFSFAATWLIATALNRTAGFRVSPEHEHGGLDLAVHGESAYDLGVTGAHSGHPTRPAPRAEPVEA
ncbi:ammonium transporter [Actinoplanes teichomyceticus]|uniref:Ammonium transporter n=1 Tax=Actinoplanes teichomyceticus TaxID=1867 RepID=A0A561VSH6_ACTTI|nr:ammonium transporter [Actinoplanes teichomyceticus]TWG14551.1 ammonium transporter [Actinoplanes teichomyceticus]GIF16897.1 ammonium transporter [Actinoplanes teichomyceticus]